MKKVTKLPSEPKFTHKLRVAAYARVSTGKDAMLHSLTAQIDYYKTKIRANPEWIFAGVYVDEAKTGTNDTREGLGQLIADCRDGKIDIEIRICGKTTERRESVDYYEAREIWHDGWIGRGYAALITVDGHRLETLPQIKTFFGFRRDSL